MLHNARAEYREEAEEIATYTVIDALATSVGDKQTAKLARDILSEEQRMAEYLSELLPQLATDVAHDEIPVSEIKGDADRRRSTSSGATSRTPRKKTSGNSTKSKSRKTSGAKRS
jgi:rubrerythrin